MTYLGRAAPIHRFGISAFRYPGPSAFWHPALRHPGTPATHSRCRGAVFALRHNVRDNGTMPVMNDEVPGEGEFDDITWRILAMLAMMALFMALRPPAG